MSEGKQLRLGQVARKLNVGRNTIISYQHENGYDIDSNPNTKIDDTLITPIIGHKGHPDIAVDAQDKVQIVWDDTRGGKVELVFLIDTSGSMSNEWADVCSVIYGGRFSG